MRTVPLFPELAIYARKFDSDKIEITKVYDDIE